MHNASAMEASQTSIPRQCEPRRLELGKERDRLHLCQPAWLMRWWYIVTLVLNIVTIVH